jgi:biopolymer transport protein ExbD
MHDPSQEGELEETEKINVVPLADLTLVLLIVLMVLSPMISQSMIHVAVPNIKNEGAGETPKETPAETPPEPLLRSTTVLR